MIMIGSLIGSIIGYKFGGFFGMLFGAFLGSKAEMWIGENLLGKPSHQTQVQQAYFQALFTSIGNLAKVDGIITVDEIRKCEMIMQKMQLNTEQRKLAIDYFNNGKQDNFDIAPTIDMFYRTAGRAYSVKQMFLEMLLEVASADNQINQVEWNLLLTICEHLRFPQQIFITLVQMRGFNVNGQRQQKTGSNYNSSRNQQQWQRATKTNPYQTLGVASTDSRTVIRRAYKKLMSTHHPDKLIAKGLPPEMIEIAKKETQNIQAAWEEVKELRGF